MEIACEMKGIHTSLLKKSVETGLDHVKLLDRADDLVGGFSGGMKVKNVYSWKFSLEKAFCGFSKCWKSNHYIFG